MYTCTSKKNVFFRSMSIWTNKSKPRYTHSWAQSAAMERWIDTDGINRYYRLILSVSFSLMLSSHRLKIFYFLLRVATIDRKNLFLPIAIDPSVNTQSIVLIH
jgi:hypothetical protein